MVDIGSGRAYLSAQLSSSIFDSAFNVIAIDSQQTNVTSSIKRLKTMKKQTTFFANEPYRGKKTSQSLSDPVDKNFLTFSQFIQSSSELNNLIEDHLRDSASFSSNEFSLIGLHSCGNLSNSIVNLYVNSNRGVEASRTGGCKLLCNVACCYNLLNEKYAENYMENSVDIKNTELSIDESSKFPMSSYLNRQEYSLSYDVRMLACHSFERLLDSYEDFREVNMNF